MGLESSNYNFNIKEQNAQEHWIIFLKSSSRYILKRDGRIIFCGLNFWIDMQIIDEDIAFKLSIRIALCNPINGVKFAFQDLLDDLFLNFPRSELVDLNSKSIFNHYDKEVWYQVWENYKKQHRIFENIHGNLELPISSTLFFKYIDERTNN